MKLLTISIAAYNVEKYLDKCLSSLNDERYRNAIEVLIIDDGSTDNTKEIAKKYQISFPNTFHYIAKRNGGHGSTINKGIELATGKYFKVIDGDDWVDSDKFYSYIEKLKSVNSDMVLNQHIEISDSQKKLIKFVRGMVEKKEYDLSEGLCIEKVTLHTLAVKTELLRQNKVKITENCFYVDVEYVIWAIYFSNTVAYFSDPVYMYRVGTADQSVNKKNMLKRVDMQKKVALKLIYLYNIFLKSELMNSNKRRMIFNTISKSVGSTFRTYLLIPEFKSSKSKIKNFDNDIKLVSNSVYDELNSVFFIKLIRKWNYSLIIYLRILYKMWCLKYEL